MLAHRSGGRCAYPGCGVALVHESETGAVALIGEAAHICGEKPGAARYVHAMTDDERNAIDNLIYMCPGHHTVIDKVPADWPTERLLQLKMSHEAKMDAATEEALSVVAFPELGRVVQWVSNAGVTVATDFRLIPPEEKIAKNGLTNRSKGLIASGLVAREVVREFVEKEAQLDSRFPERLKAGFLEHYYRLRKEGLGGDELFEMMHAVAERGSSDRADRAAGLAVLVYLFEICDVFEK